MSITTNLPPELVVRLLLQGCIMRMPRGHVLYPYGGQLGYDAENHTYFCSHCKRSTPAPSERIKEMPYTYENGYGRWYSTLLKEIHDADT